MISGTDLLMADRTDSIQAAATLSELAMAAEQFQTQQLVSQYPDQPKVSVQTEMFYLLNAYMYPSRRPKIMFCAIKSLFKGSCSNFAYFSVQMGHIFLPSLKMLSSK